MGERKDEWHPSIRRRRGNGKVHGGTKTRAQQRNDKREIEKLLQTVDPKAKPPASFAFWTNSMMLLWLRQNQRRDND